MYSFVKRAIIPLTAAAVSLLAALLARRNPHWLWVLAVSLPVLLLGIFDWLQKAWNITRNYPVAGRIRWIFYRLPPYLRAYIVEDDLHGKPISFAAPKLVPKPARGQIDNHTFSTHRDTAGRQQR